VGKALALHPQERVQANGRQVPFPCCPDGAVAKRIWDWRRFRFIDTAPWAEALHGELLAIFRDDPEVELLGSSPDFPLGGP
jgi:hypothetical protein